MVDVVVFGTGSNGERAWRAAATRPDINVVCFADNDPRKHGARLHDRAIVGPAGLGDQQFDFIVLASMYASEIERQLQGLGVPRDAVVVPDPNQFAEIFAELPARKRANRSVRLDDDTTVVERDLPRLLVVSAGVLNHDDEASLPVRAIVRAFPGDRLCNVARAAAGRPWIDRSFAVPATDRTTAAAAVARELRARNFVPAVVFAAVRGDEDLALLHAVIAAIPSGVPVILFCLDGEPREIAEFEAQVLAGGARRYEVWAADAALGAAIESHSARPVTVVPPWAWDAVPSAPRRLRSVDSTVRAVMIGRVPEPAMLPSIRQLWRRCREAFPALTPIEWYVHPADVQAAIEAGGDLGEEIAWRGAYDGDRLQSRLASADLAIVPVNLDADADTASARWGVPARLAEICGAALPIFAIASPDTATARLIDTAECGVVAAGHDEAALATRLIALMRNREGRAVLGARARVWAEQAMDPAPIHARATGRMVRLARTYTPPAEWNAPRAEGLVRLAGSEKTASARLEDVLTDRIHYACGRNVLAGWLNVDGYDESFPSGEVPSEIAGSIFRLDLTGRHPFPDNYFRLGYSEDFVEHIDQAEFMSFLCECYRTFEPGGVLRLSSPGLEGVLRRHLRGSDWQAASVLREEAYERWWHKHFLCFAEVEAIGRHIGWREVRQVPYGESAVADLRQDTRPTQADLNLVVELVK